MKTIFGALTLTLFVAWGSPALAGSCGSDADHSHANASHASYDGKADLVTVAVEAGSFKTLAAALTAAGLVDALQGDGPFTVFAPTDEAFAKLPAGTVDKLLEPGNREMLKSILTYHVVPGALKAGDVVSRDGAKTLNGQKIAFETRGKAVFTNDSRVTGTDIMASNGIIHVIDTVLLPEDKNLVEVASEAGSFGTLLAAAQAAGLAEMLGQDGPFTVFAPTDQAFADLPKGTVEDLLKPENRNQLRDILSYHVVSGRVLASEAVEAGDARTAEGSSINFRMRDGKLNVNDAKLLATDIQAENGVIHVIDRVLLPSR